MSFKANRFLTSLTTMLGERGQDRLYDCIRDLVENGLVLSRFAPGEWAPQRQDITQYLAAWSRHAGLSDEECRGWLVDFCAEVLVSISRRTPAAIRHSTKSNIKYIYKDAVPFLCELEANRFRARCCSDCPVHAEMEAKLAERANEAKKPRVVPCHAPPQVTIVQPVKAIYREQFQVAQQLVRDELGKGTRKKRILELLRQQGLKTRTGRPWTSAILNSEIAKLPAPQAGAGADRTETVPLEAPGLERQSSPEQ